MFHFRRGGFTPPENFLENELSPILNTINRTANAENQDLVVFNRVPKTGSEMFQVGCNLSLGYLKQCGAVVWLRQAKIQQ